MDDQKSEMLTLFGWVSAIIIIAVVMLYPYSNYQFTSLGISDGVNLYACKYMEPAPMGLVDYGVSSYGNVYNISTHSIESSINLDNFVTNFSNNYNASIQLNLNIMLDYGNKTQAYFVQNVILMDTNTRQINFIDNIWNDSSINASLNGNLIKGNGTVSPSNKNNTYYFYQAENQTGDNITLKNNQTVYLRTNSSISRDGNPEIIFSYNDGKGWKEYDKVSLLVNNSIKNYSIIISGFNYTPSYNFYDAGIIIGGPGDGYNTTLINGSAVLTLSYWNGNNFQNVEDAYNFGCDTEEGINNAVVTPNFYSSGLLYANVSSGNNAYLGNLWSINSSNIGVLYINSSINNIIISFNKTGHVFNSTLNNGTGEFTIESGRYLINAYKNGNLVYSENYTIKQEKVSVLNIK